MSLPRVGQLADLAINCFFPKQCIGCRRLGSFLCSNCKEKLHRLLPPICPGCGSPQASGILCASCRQRQSEIDGIRSPFRFDGVIREAIHQLKYQNLRAISSCLAQLLADYLESNPLPGEVLVAVPLHPRRLRERGYNQSSLLARELARFTGLPVVEDCVIRVKQAVPQARTANVEERRRNVANAFACRDGRVAGKQVIVIDDVCTSGATLESCAAVLKSAGAISVWGLTLAREVRGSNPC